MQAREHHFFFAKKMIPTHTFQSTDKMFSELTGPKREAFLFYLWNEAAKGVDQPLPHVDNFRGADGIPRLAKLEVVGALKPAGTEIVVVSMPPALNPNEALFFALVRRPTGVSVFFYERCMGSDHATVSANEAVLAEVRSDGSRLNHGFKEGLDLEAFKNHLGGVLDVSLAGLETSLPPVTMAAFVGASRGAAGGPSAAPGRGKALGNFLVIATLIAAVGPMAIRALWWVMPMLGSLVSPVWRILDPLLGVVVGIGLLIWIYQVHDGRRGQTSMSPAMSVVWWFIPLAQLFMIPATLASAWRGVMGTGGLGLAWLWWIFMIPAMMVRNLNMMASMQGGMVIPDGPLGEVLKLAFTYGWAVQLIAYGTLYYIIKNVTAKL